MTCKKCAEVAASVREIDSVVKIPRPDENREMKFPSQTGETSRHDERKDMRLYAVGS